MLLHHARNHESDNLALQSLKLAPLTPFSLNNLGFAMERKVKLPCTFLFFFSSRRRHTRSLCDWSSYVCSSDLASVETRFNHLDPFNKAKWLYLTGFVLACCAWLGWSKPFNRAAWGLMAFTFVVHTVALGVRMYLSGRPPVTNLYSSAIFIGWGCVLLGLTLERFYKLGIGNVVAAVAGFVTLQIAHILAAEGDTMEVLQAVLDT